MDDLNLLDKVFQVNDTSAIDTAGATTNKSKANIIDDLKKQLNGERLAKTELAREKRELEKKLDELKSEHSAAIQQIKSLQEKLTLQKRKGEDEKARLEEVIESLTITKRKQEKEIASLQCTPVHSFTHVLTSCQDGKEQSGSGLADATGDIMQETHDEGKTNKLSHAPIKRKRKTAIENLHDDLHTGIIEGKRSR